MSVDMWREELKKAVEEIKNILHNTHWRAIPLIDFKCEKALRLLDSYVKPLLNVDLSSVTPECIMDLFGDAYGAILMAIQTLKDIGCKKADEYEKKLKHLLIRYTFRLLSLAEKYRGG